MELINYIIN